MYILSEYGEIVFLSYVADSEAKLLDLLGGRGSGMSKSRQSNKQKCHVEISF